MQPDYPKEDLHNLELYKKAIEELEHWMTRYLLSLFQKKSLFLPEQLYDFEKIKISLGLIDSYIPLMNSLLEMFQRKHLITKTESTNSVFTCQNFQSTSQLEEERNSLRLKYPFLDPEIIFSDSILESYFDILAGKINFINIMFPSGKFHNIEHIYKNNYDSIFHNKIMASVFKNILSNYNKSNELNILEIGAGIGSTTDYLLPLLENQQDKYYYTDISQAFTRYGIKNYLGKYNFIQFKTLNIENEPLQQGFKDEFNIIIASNVLHATRDIVQTLKNAAKLLNSGGYLLLNECTIKRDYSTLLFGLSSGWWLSTDSWRINGTPFLTFESWQTVLTLSGFENISSVTKTFETNTVGYQDIIICQKK